MCYSLGIDPWVFGFENNVHFGELPILLLLVIPNSEEHLHLFVIVTDESLSEVTGLVWVHVKSIARDILLVRQLEPLLRRTLIETAVIERLQRKP